MVLQHGRPVQQARARRSSRPAWPPARTTRHHRRAGLADHLRREVRRRLRRRRTAARAGRRADVHHRRDRGRSSASSSPGLDTLDIAVFWGGSPTIASTQTILVNAALSGGALPRAEHLRPVGPRGRATTSWSSPASTSSRWPCRGAAPRTRSGSSATRGSPTCKALGGVFNTRADARRPADRRRPPSRRPRTWTPTRPYAALTATAAQVMNQMPPRENPRVNKSLDSVHASGPLGRAHCVIHGNQNYKQTGLLQAYAAYSLLQQPPQAGRLRLGLPGVRAPRAARRAAQLRAGRGAGRSPSEALSAVRLVDYLDKGASLGPGRALPDHRRAEHVATPRCRSSAAASRRRWSAPGVAAGRHGRDPVGQRPGRVHLRVRDQPGRRRVVPDQPAQRGGREPRAARPVRLPRADLPGVVRAAGRADPRRPARGSTTLVCLDGDAGRGRADAGTEFLAARAERRAGRRPAGRRPRDDRRHRRHHRPAQGRDAHRRPTSRR